MILSLTNPKTDLSKVTEVYALYTFVGRQGEPDAELILIDPVHTYSIEERIRLLKEKSETTVTLDGNKRGAKLKAIYVEIPNETN